MRTAIALIAFIAISCGPVTAGPVTTSSPAARSSSITPTATPSPSAAPGTFTMPTDRDMVTFAADRGALIAFSSKEGLPPYESRVQRADPTTSTWRTVYTADAHVVGGQVVAGRAAVVEYREPFQGGGAYSADFTVIDLSTGKASKIDGFALSSATFRGGGALTRRPVGSVILGQDRIAWTRLIEGPSGAVSGELRVAAIVDPAKFVVIGSSTEWIAALGLDAHRLLYVTGGKTEDQLHIRDLDTFIDRILTTGAVGDQQVVAGIPGFDRASLAGDWAIWLETPGATAGKIRAINLVSGAERTIDTTGSSCAELSAGTRYVAWYCSNAFGILDVVTLDPIGAPTGIGVAPMARDDALLWFTVVPGGRSITLYRPR